MAGAVNAIVGVVAIAAGIIFEQPWLISAGASLLIGAAAALLAKKPGLPPVSPIDVSYSGTLEPRRIVYGRIKAAGMYVIPPLTSGTNNDFFHTALVFAGHPILSIDDVYFDVIRIDSRDIAPVTRSANDGLVSNTFSLNGYQGLAWIRRYLGTQSFVDFILNQQFSCWDSNHIGHGLPYMAIQLKFDPTVFTAGLPQFTAVLRGKLCYDPRLDSSNGGTGAQRNLDPATWAYTTNLALCLRDFLTSPLGMGEEQARIDDVLVIAAANICDEALTVPLPILTGFTNWVAGSAVVVGVNTAFQAVLLANGFVLAPNGSMLQVRSVDSDLKFTLMAPYPGANAATQLTLFNNSGTGQTAIQARYTCNTVLDCTARAEDNLAQLARGMMGQCYYSSGMWRMFAGVWMAPAFTLAEDDLVGAVSIQCHTPRTDLYNAVRGNFLDPQQNYQPNEFPAILNSTYETTDGERIYTETNFACCTNSYECQRNAMVISRQSRNAKIITAQYGMSAFRIRPFETGVVTIGEIGWSNQSVRCTSWKFYPNGIIELQLQEAYAADWTDPDISQYNITGINTAPPPGQYLPYPPIGLSFRAMGSAIQFIITLPSQVIPGTVVEVWEGLTITPFSAATLIASGASTTFLIPKRDTVTRFYWCRTRGPNGQVSPTFPTVNGLSMAASQIQTPEIAPGAVTATQIADGTITPVKFVSGLQLIQIVASLPALPNAAFPINTVIFNSSDNHLYTNVANVWTSISANPAGLITTTQIADDAITTPKIAANAVVANSILAGAITADKLVTNIITAGSALIADGAITNANIGNLQVTNANIANLTVGTSKIADGAISGVALGTGPAGSVGTNHQLISFNYTSSGGAVLVLLQIGGFTTTTSNAQFNMRINNVIQSSLSAPGTPTGIGGTNPFFFMGMIPLLVLAPGTYTFSVDAQNGGATIAAPVLFLIELKK